MNNRWVFGVAVTAVLASLTTVSAAENATFSGTIGVGGMVISNGNNLNPNGSKKYLDSLDSAAGNETTVLPVILPRINWDVGEYEGLKLYLTADPPIDEVGGFALNLGGAYSVAGVGIIDTAAYFTPFEEVWENPYATEVAREETDTSKYGFRVGMNRIMGTGLRVHFVYLNDDVDEDVIGSLMPELDRDGAVYSLNLNYSIHVNKTLEIRPRLSIRKGDYEGEANSFMKYKFDLEARYRTGRLMVVPRMYYSHSDYDETNPIFEKTRENDSYGCSLMTTYMAPFNWQKWSVTGLFALSEGDSNINFYDTESLTLGGIMSYHF